jgi:hypothetical protein
MVLPLRPEDFTGLLISEVDLEKGMLCFGTRLQGRDFTKGRQSFVTPFPREIMPLILVCIGGRKDGPLLRKRTVFEHLRRAELQVESSSDVVSHFDQALAVAPAEKTQTEQDQKALVRRILRQMGGVNSGSLAKEFKSLVAATGVPTAVSTNCEGRSTRTSTMQACRTLFSAK